MKLCAIFKNQILRRVSHLIEGLQQRPPTGEILIKTLIFTEFRVFMTLFYQNNNSVNLCEIILKIHKASIILAPA